VSIHKWPICPISALREKFNPRNINHMPPVKFFVRLDLDQIFLFVDGHELDLQKRSFTMANVEDYTSGKIQEQAAQALAFLKSADEPLSGSEQGERMLAIISTFEPRLLNMTEAEQRIQAAEHCAVGPRVCHPNNPETEFTEAVFLDALAEGMAAAGKAEMVSNEKALETLAKYKKNPLVQSTVSGKPLELCRCSPDTCIYWNMEKRGLMCLRRK
jgi:hypothetical protein